jgi:hypothetical protein
MDLFQAGNDGYNKKLLMNMRRGFIPRREQQETHDIIPDLE